MSAESEAEKQYTNEEACWWAAVFGLCWAVNSVDQMPTTAEAIKGRRKVIELCVEIADKVGHEVRANRSDEKPACPCGGFEVDGVVLHAPRCPHAGTP